MQITSNKTLALKLGVGVYSGADYTANITVVPDRSSSH